MSLAQDSPPASFLAERPEDGEAVERLVLDAFGPGRYAKAAERLREGRQPLRPLSFIAWEGGRAVGCVRQWAVTVGGAPALLLGPYAIAAERRSRGIGAALLDHACRAAAEAGFAVIVLVGDAPFYAPFGFVTAPAVTLPGPVDPRRVLRRVLRPDGERLAGPVLPA